MRFATTAIRGTLTLTATMATLGAAVVASAPGCSAADRQTPAAPTPQAGPGPTAAKAPTQAASTVIRPFDGKGLTGWAGDPSHWSVEDGAIVGRSTNDNPLNTSTYLVWEGSMPDDFELRARVRISGGNSGIQYRSRLVDGQADMAGFQMDLDAQDSYTGVLYEGLGRGLMSARGEQVEWSPSGKRLVAQFATDERLKPMIRRDDWNEFRIEACGPRVRHWINGTLMSEVTDADPVRFRRGGKIALQLHAGPPMEVRWADLEVRRITGDPTQGTQQHSPQAPSGPAATQPTTPASARP